ncbi:desulfoferrodoxin [bacterium]|nr:desulfoferrodoxin [bacterium]
MGTKILEIYRCEECGGIVEVLHAGVLPSCCGQPMKKVKAGITDAAQEKHVPVIEKQGDVVTITVGSVEHPMEEKHYIEWIELIANKKSYLQFLKPGEPPKAVFQVKAEKLTVREHCNLHGLWEARA